VRGDQTISSKSTLFGRFTYWKLLSLRKTRSAPDCARTVVLKNSKSKSLAIGYNRVIGSNTTANINASISRFQYLRTPKNSGFDMAQEGWPSAYNALVPGSERTRSLLALPSTTPL